MIALCGDCGWGEMQDGACPWCAGLVHIPGNLAVQQDRARAIDVAHDAALVEGVDREHVAALLEDAARDATAGDVVCWPQQFRRRRTA